ncbi:MAG: alpha/beta fold hydrolase [Ilumatobacteraceae bacterium]
MQRRWFARLVGVGVSGCLIVASCSPSGVRLSRSDQREVSTTSGTTADAPDPTTPDSTTPDPTTPDATTPDSTTPDSTTSAAPSTPPASTAPGEGGLPDIDPVAWTDCPDQAAPWQCGSITVPMDYARPAARQLTIALNRLPATDRSVRIGSLILNPGGPGGSGIEIAYGEADQLPVVVLERFDIVGFDPRGVGRSSAVECPDDSEFDDSYAACIAVDEELLAYLGTRNAARDLELIRRAVRDEQLTYLGYSYGTALGAVYADMFPDRVRALVLDGAIDPDAGTSNIDGGDGYDFYAEQDFEQTLEVFHTLCDATIGCRAGPNSHEVLDRVFDTVRDTPAPYFAAGERLTRSDVDDVVYSSMYSAFNWPILGVALRDADDGDASTLAAMYSWLQFGYPADMEAEANFDFANVAIRCADFENRGSSSSECQEFPETAEPLPLITAIDAPTPILVVGTKDDPATPGRYAEQLADALGDAVSITWDGAGHTAFLTSGCITDIVTAYIVDQIVPRDGETCPFVTGADTIGERADRVFADLPRETAVEAIGPLLGDHDILERLAPCVAEGIVDNADERLIIHQLLGVESPELVRLRNIVTLRCQVRR